MKKSDILKELFDKDYVEREIELSDDAPKIVVRTIDYEKQMELEDHLRDLANSGIAKRKFLQQYACALLSYTLVRWGSMKDSTPEQWASFLKNKSVGLLDRIVKEQQDLEKQVREALNLENIEETFFPKEELPDESKPSQAESTQDEEGLYGKQSSRVPSPKKKNEI